MLFSFPDDLLRMAILYPFFLRIQERCFPISPVPPVINTVFMGMKGFRYKVSNLADNQQPATCNVQPLPSTQ
jgi:hypothetical protein